MTKIIKHEKQSQRPKQDSDNFLQHSDTQKQKHKTIIFDTDMDRPMTQEPKIEMEIPIKTKIETEIPAETKISTTGSCGNSVIFPHLVGFHFLDKI